MGAQFISRDSVDNACVQVLRIYDPDFESVSLDEAYLDVTSCVRHSMNEGGGCNAPGRTHLSIANEIRERVLEATGLTCSAGAAANKLIAKVCR